MDAHENIEGLLVLPPDHTFFGDHDLGEEGLVHLLAQLWASCQVGLVAILGPADCLHHDRLDLPHARLGLGQGALCGLHLGGDSFLLDLQQVEWDGSGVVGVEQLGAFIVKGTKALSLTLLFVFGVGLPLGKLGDHRSGGLSESVGGELDQSVVVLDLFFHQSQRPVLQHAGGALLMATNTEVVHVVLAGLGAAVGNAQLRAAVPAEDGALQVVRVLAGFGALSMRFQHGLHPVPGCLVDDWLVLALILDPIETDDALVVRAGKYPVELAFGQHFSRCVRTALAPETPFGRLGQ